MFDRFLFYKLFDHSDQLRCHSSAILSAYQLINNYYFPSELREHLQRFVNYYNHERYHDSLDNLTPVDVHYGRGHKILEQRDKIKIATLTMRRKMH